jgi:uncharacterized protein YybS (DUF2232 family)
MKYPDKGAILDLVKGCVVTLAFFLAYVTFPLAGLVPGLFAPLPAIYYGLKSGRTYGVAIVTFSALVMTLIGGATFALYYLMQAGVISLVLPVFLATGRKGAKAIAYTVAVNLGVILVLAGVYGVTHGINPHEQAIKVIHSSITQVGALYEQVGIKGDELTTLREGMQQAGILIGRVYPALIVISLMLIVGLNLAVLAKFSGRLPDLPAAGDIRDFRNPEQLVWVLIVAGFAMLVENRQVTTAALNTLIVVVSLYFMQGLAIIIHFFTRFAVPKFARLLLYFFLALQPYLAVGVAALGIFDIWGDFRSPKKHENL